MERAYQSLAATIAEATPHGLTLIYARVVEVWGKGGLPDEEAARLLADIDARRSAAKTARRPALFSTGRARPKVRNRSAAQARRRRWAFAGWIPGELIERHGLTIGETAVLSVVACELRTRGRCALPVAKIAALAGVCHRLAQSAMQMARRLGLLSIEERRRPGLPSLTNVVRIAATSWLRWLKARGEGAKKGARPVTPYISGEDTRRTCADAETTNGLGRNGALMGAIDSRDGIAKSRVRNGNETRTQKKRARFRP